MKIILGTVIWCNLGFPHRSSGKSPEWFRISPELVSSKESCPNLTGRLGSNSMSGQTPRKFFKKSLLGFLRHVKYVILVHSRNLCNAWRVVSRTIFMVVSFRCCLFSLVWKRFYLWRENVWTAFTTDMTFNSILTLKVMFFSSTEIVLFNMSFRNCYSGTFISPFCAVFLMGTSFVYISNQITNREKYLHIETTKWKHRLWWDLNTFSSISFLIGRVFSIFWQKTDEHKPSEMDIEVFFSCQHTIYYYKQLYKKIP